MTNAPRLRRGPLGNIIDEDAINGIHITINGDELTWATAARQLRTLAELVEAKSMSAEGFNWEYGGEYNLQVIMPDMFDHGDYQDAEGNLIHIADDEVISCVWASKGAESETLDPPIPAWKWAQEHGPLTRAGIGEADGDTGGTVHPLH
jgi:hypothetical protein